MSVEALGVEALASEIVSSVERAMRSSPSAAHSLTVAGVRVTLEVTSDVASFVLAPFAHLQSEGTSESELAIAVAALPDSDVRSWELDKLPDTGMVFGTADRIVHLHRESAMLFDRHSSSIRALVRTVGGVASWHRAKPMQVPLSIFLADRGIDLVHGGLVALDGEGLLIAGMGGSGKSTLTMASLLEGLDFLGDDCVGVEEVDGTFAGYSVFGSGCLERTHLARFPGLATRTGVGNPGDGKGVLSIAELFPERMVPSTCIRGIVLPRVTYGERVTVRPASGRDALLALAPSSILKRAVPPAATMARIARLVRSVPAWHLEMGPVEEAGAGMRRLLREGRSGK